MGIYTNRHPGMDYEDLEVMEGNASIQTIAALKFNDGGVLLMRTGL